jgi:hypothetical protein
MPQRSKFDRPIAYHRAFVGVVGSVNAAVMLSQAVYWSTRTTGVDGWFWKTRDQWEEEIGLSRYEQEGARKLLSQHSFWKEELRNAPAKMHFYVDQDKLDDAVDEWVDRQEWVADIDESIKTVKTKDKTNVPVGGKPANILYTEMTHR